MNEEDFLRKWYEKFGKSFEIVPSFEEFKRWRCVQSFLELQKENSLHLSPQLGLVEEQGNDGEWSEVGEYLGCCDCGLVHSVQFMVQDAPMPPRVFIKVARDRELTEQARRDGGLKYIRKSTPEGDL